MFREFIQKKKHTFVLNCTINFYFSMDEHEVEWVFLDFTFKISSLDNLEA